MSDHRAQYPATYRIYKVRLIRGNGGGWAGTMIRNHKVTTFGAVGMIVVVSCTLFVSGAQAAEEKKPTAPVVVDLQTDEVFTDALGNQLVVDARGGDVGEEIISGHTEQGAPVVMVI